MLLQLASRIFNDVITSAIEVLLKSIFENNCQHKSGEIKKQYLPQVF